MLEVEGSRAEYLRNALTRGGAGDKVRLTITIPEARAHRVIGGVVVIGEASINDVHAVSLAFLNIAGIWQGECGTNRVVRLIEGAPRNLPEAFTGCWFRNCPG